MTTACQISAHATQGCTLIMIIIIIESSWGLRKSGVPGSHGVLGSYDAWRKLWRCHGSRRRVRHQLVAQTASTRDCSTPSSDASTELSKNSSSASRIDAARNFTHARTHNESSVHEHSPCVRTVSTAREPTRPVTTGVIDTRGHGLVIRASFWTPVDMSNVTVCTEL